MTTSAAPPVTIGVPVYNGARYLEEAVRSLLDQTFGDFALVISDNCSTDETPAICARLCEQDPRIRYVRQERNLGASGNFEYLLRQARSPFFMWAAHDDLRAPTYVATCMELLARAPDAVACAVGAHIVDEQGNSIQRLLPPSDLSSYDVVARSRAVFKRGQMSIYGLMRRELVPPTAALRDIRGGDIAFVFSLALNHRIATTNEVLITYRMVNGEAKTSGPNAHLYDGTRPQKEMFTLMRTQVDAGAADSVTQARLRAVLITRAPDDRRMALSNRNRLSIRRARCERRWGSLVLRVPIHMALGPDRAATVRRNLQSRHRS
jgi:glycosyltransferase involved in cell wall biosynthesis